ncbi:hypothetical protein PUN28_000361 [Cardiocondyla obscurior]|uniref:Uncharacterized protein n=1 Tax=Cardiocondyla obscurior TaxID=286306 RepID=A0AAW2GZ47_9HYME
MFRYFNLKQSISTYYVRYVTRNLRRLFFFKRKRNPRRRSLSRFSKRFSFYSPRIWALSYCFKKSVSALFDVCDEIFFIFTRKRSCTHACSFCVTKRYLFLVLYIRIYFVRCIEARKPICIAKK